MSNRRRDKGRFKVFCNSRNVCVYYCRTFDKAVRVGVGPVRNPVHVADPEAFPARQSKQA